MITHEEAREINRIGKRTFISALNMINSEEVEVKQNNKNYVFPNDFNKIADYITQQEKVTELLGLYRRAINNIYVNDTLMYDLIQKANKLEKELGEMK